MADNITPVKKSVQKPRVKKAVPYDAEAVAAAITAEIAKNRPPFYRRAVFIAPAIALMFAAIPFLRAAVNLLRPDRDKPEPLAFDATPAATPQRKLAAFAAQFAALRAEHPEFTDVIVRGAHHDATLTPGFLAAVAARCPLTVNDADTEIPVVARETLETLDGIELTRLAQARAEQLTPESAAAIRAAHVTRLRLAHWAVTSADTPAALQSAIAQVMNACEEIRIDRRHITPGLGQDTALMRRLALDALPPASAGAIAARFDLAIEAAPDAGLNLMYGKDSDPLAENSTFEKLQRFGRRPHAHRGKVTELHRLFGLALAQPTFAEAIAKLSPASHDTETRRLACMLLRDSALKRLGQDESLAYFYDEIPVAPREFDRFLLRFAAVATADDAYGESLLLHRRAVLLKLVALLNRARFEAAATAYTLAFDHRRALDGGKWPKSTEGLLDGLLATYPADPFTGEPVAYARKTLRLTSPGADLNPRGGLDEPEFATELMQLWEPTVSLDPEPGTKPEAFGLRAADLEKPVRRPWEIVPKQPKNEPTEGATEAPSVKGG